MIVRIVMKRLDCMHCKLRKLTHTFFIELYATAAIAAIDNAEG